ncbi:hypothetical protein Tco_0943057 [Tanacetum coccineum]
MASHDSMTALSYNDRKSIDLGDDWAWVSTGPERQQVAAAGTPALAEDAPAINEGDQAVPAPVQRRIKQRTNGVSTSTAQQDPQQPDP